MALGILALGQFLKIMFLELYYGVAFKLLERLLKIIAYLFYIKQGDMLFFIALFYIYVHKV